MAAGSGSFFNWGWQKQHVNGQMLDGRHIIPDSTVILVGPALLSQMSDTVLDGEYLTRAAKGILQPLGSIGGLTLNQMRQNSPIFEVGAKRAFIVPGKMAYGCDLSGFTLYGPSILRRLSALQPSPESSGGSSNEMHPIDINTSYGKWFPREYKLSPGFGIPSADGNTKNRDFYIALASELFNVPIGLAMIFRNSQSGGYGGLYMEEVMIDSHQTGISAGESVIMEQVRLTFSLLLPLNVADLSY